MSQTFLSYDKHPGVNTVQINAIFWIDRGEIRPSVELKHPHRVVLDINNIHGEYVAQIRATMLMSGLRDSPRLLVPGTNEEAGILKDPL